MLVGAGQKAAGGPVGRRTWPVASQRGRAGCPGVLLSIRDGNWAWPRNTRTYDCRGGLACGL